MSREVIYKEIITLYQEHIEELINENLKLNNELNRLKQKEKINKLETEIINKIIEY